MPGHMGTERVSIQNLRILGIDTENNIVQVSGAIPGVQNSLVTIKPTVKRIKVAAPPPPEKKK